MRNRHPDDTVQQLLVLSAQLSRDAAWLLALVAQADADDQGITNATHPPLPTRATRQDC